MRRLLWLGVGLAVGALAVRAVSKAAKRYSPSGMAESARDSATGFLDSVRDFVADVRDGMAEREAQLHAAMAQGVTFDEYDDDLSAGGRHEDLSAGGRHEDLSAGRSTRNSESGMSGD